MDEDRFWSMIESAWGAVGGKVKSRQRLAEGRLSGDARCSLRRRWRRHVVPALQEQLAGLPAEELLAFDRILERKLYDIDRADIQERTDGSDDGFLYCRGFIVGMGRGYYEAVRANPDRAVMDAECEEMCYLSWHLYHEQVRRGAAVGHLSRDAVQLAGWA